MNIVKKLIKENIIIDSNNDLWEIYNRDARGEIINDMRFYFNSYNYFIKKKVLYGESKDAPFTVDTKESAFNPIRKLTQKEVTVLLKDII
jgi:hypothetical protein